MHSDLTVLILLLSTGYFCFHQELRVPYESIGPDGTQ